MPIYTMVPMVISVARIDKFAELAELSLASVNGATLSTIL